jgi:hypothetical protein
MTVSIVKEDGVATVWDDQFEIDCPKCKTTVFKNTVPDQDDGTPRYCCPNCSGSVELVGQYWLVNPNQSAWPGHEKGDRFDSTLRCKDGCGWNIHLRNQDQLLTHDACGAKIGSKFINGLSDFELTFNPIKAFTSLF